MVKMTILNLTRINLRITKLRSKLLKVLSMLQGCGCCHAGDENEIVGSPPRPHPDSETSLTAT